jgi:hypothetical protein
MSASEEVPFMRLDIPGNWLVWGISSVVPLTVIVLVAYLAYYSYQFYLSLIIQGKPDEWVVVINNDKMVQAGIGLRVTRGLTDQVAVFPSKINKFRFFVD